MLSVTISVFTFGKIWVDNVGDGDKKEGSTVDELWVVIIVVGTSTSSPVMSIDSLFKIDMACSERKYILELVTIHNY